MVYLSGTINNDVIERSALCHLAPGCWWSEVLQIMQQRRTSGLVQVSAVHLQTGNLRLGTTYILACIRWSWGDPEINSRLQSERVSKLSCSWSKHPGIAGRQNRRGFSELRLNQGDNPFQHYYYPFISEQKGNANMHVLNLFSTFNLSVHYVYTNIYSYSSL